MRQTLVRSMLLIFFFNLSAAAQTTSKATKADTSVALREVGVRSSRQAISYQSGKTILKVAGNKTFATSANLMDVLRKAPGVITLPDGQIQLSGGNTPVVFINGKPSELPVSEVQAYLSGLNPDQVESIELIPNPSARYDGQYKAIIDIRLKNPDDGWTGNLGTSLRQNVYFSADNNLNLAYRKRKAGINILAGYVKGTDYYRYNALQKLASGTFLTTNTIRATEVSSPRLQLLAEYPLANNQDLDVSVRAFWGSTDRTADNTLMFRPVMDGSLNGNNYTQTLSDPRQRNYSANINYTLRMDSTDRISVFASGTTVSNLQREDIQINDVLKGTRDAYWKTNLKNQLALYTIQTDWTKDLKQSTVEAGFKYALSNTENDLRYDTLGAGGAFYLDPNRTNRFNYRENIFAGYMAYGYRWAKADLKLSLRAEQTRAHAESVTTGDVTTNNYLSLLPSVLFNYQLKNNRRFTFTLTRRMTRPGFDQLNPFRFYLSPLNYWVGNPFLRPAVTSLMNVAYTQGSWNMNLTLARERHMLTRYPQYDPATNELLYLGANLPHRDYSILETSYAFNLTNWWKATNTLAAYYNKQQMPYFGTTYAIPVYDFNYSGSQIFLLPKGWTADVTYFYRSRSGSSLYTQRPYSSLDLGLQKKWLGGKLNTRLNSYDLFYTQVTSLTFRHTHIMDNQLNHRSATRRIVLSLQYDLGRIAYKAKTGKTSEEQRRVGQ